MKINLELDDVAHFTWSYHHRFFVEVKGKGNFEWSDPEYPGGDNTIKRYNGTYEQWCKDLGIPFGRDKGTHTIEGYCGKDVKIQ